MPGGTCLAMGRCLHDQCTSTSVGLLSWSSTACGQSTWWTPKLTAPQKARPSPSDRDSCINGFVTSAASGHVWTEPLAKAIARSSSISSREKRAASCAFAGELRAATEVRSEPTPVTCDGATDDASSCSERASASEAALGTPLRPRRFLGGTKEMVAVSVSLGGSSSTDASETTALSPSCCTREACGHEESTPRSTNGAGTASEKRSTDACALRIVSTFV
mmetsp:Transcript_27979/g.83827  ORF Transcript_27979/g.83827 Transcript_27979/m.83827 type:complete len:220 (-) Transcript_27979:61-720(-)